MEVRCAFLANEVTATAETNPNVVGMASQLTASDFPAPIANLTFALILEAYLGAEDPRHIVQVNVLKRESGTELFTTRDMHVETGSKADDGDLIQTYIFISLEGLVLPSAGFYDFHIFVDGQHKSTLALQVKLARK